MPGRWKPEHPGQEGWRLHVTGQGQVCNSLSLDIVLEREHPEKPLLDMSRGIGHGRVPVEVKNVDGDLPQHSMDAIIKLGWLTVTPLSRNCDSDWTNHVVDVVWPDWRQLHNNSVKKVGGRESGSTYLYIYNISGQLQYICIFTIYIYIYNISLYLMFTI